VRCFKTLAQAARLLQTTVGKLRYAKEGGKHIIGNRYRINYDYAAGSSALHQQDSVEAQDQDEMCAVGSDAHSDILVERLPTSGTLTDTDDGSILVFHSVVEASNFLRMTPHQLTYMRKMKQTSVSDGKYTIAFHQKEDLPAITTNTVGQPLELCQPSVMRIGRRSKRMKWTGSVIDIQDRSQPVKYFHSAAEAAELLGVCIDTVRIARKRGRRIREDRFEIRYDEDMSLHMQPGESGDQQDQEHNMSAVQRMRTPSEIPINPGLSVEDHIWEDCNSEQEVVTVTKPRSTSMSRAHVLVTTNDANGEKVREFWSIDQASEALGIPGWQFEEALHEGRKQAGEMETYQVQLPTRLGELDIMGQSSSGVHGQASAFAPEEETIVLHCGTNPTPIGSVEDTTDGSIMALFSLNQLQTFLGLTQSTNVVREETRGTSIALEGKYSIKFFDTGDTGNLQLAAAAAKLPALPYQSPYVGTGTLTCADIPVSITLQHTETGDVHHLNTINRCQVTDDQLFATTMAAAAENEQLGSTDMDHTSQSEVDVSDTVMLDRGDEQDSDDWTLDEDDEQDHDEGLDGAKADGDSQMPEA
jgi:hypothetical protein